MRKPYTFITQELQPYTQWSSQHYCKRLNVFINITWNHHMKPSHVVITWNHHM